MNVAEQLRAYAAVMGHERAQRQAALAAEHFPCCGAKRAKGLHAAGCGVQRAARLAGDALRELKSRNSSRQRPDSGTAKECLEVFARLRRDQPALSKWIEDGYPTLTEAEHIERFGEPYRSYRKARA